MGSFEGFVCLLAFGLASGVGVAPRIIGARLDPHDSYQGQFVPDPQIGRIKKNARIMLAGLPASADCRPSPAGAPGRARPSTVKGGSRETAGEGVPWFALTLTVFALYLFARGSSR